MLTRLIKSKCTLLPYLTILLFLLTACNDASQHRPAAPLGNITALQALEKSYNAILNDLPAGPTSLRPSARRKFVERVFSKAGYDYSATIIALSNTPANEINQFHKDMKELLLLPHRQLNFEDVKEIYSQQEQDAILKIEQLI